MLLVAFGSLVIVMREYTMDYMGSAEDCHDEYEDADAAVLKAANLLCTASCPCDISDSTATEIGLINYVKGSASKVQDCKPCEAYDAINEEQQAEVQDFLNEYSDEGFNECKDSDYDSIEENYFSDDQRDYFDLIEWAEDFFDCGGLCVSPGKYLFSDVDK